MGCEALSVERIIEKRERADCEIGSLACLLLNMEGFDACLSHQRAGGHLSCYEMEHYRWSILCSLEIPRSPHVARDEVTRLLLWTAGGQSGGRCIPGPDQ